MDRERLRTQVVDRLGSRALVFAGIRGSDVESISDIPQLSASYSIIDAYRRHTIDSIAYEDLTGTRVDLDSWDIDDHLDDPESIQFRRGLLTALATPSALLPYRPSQFLSAIAFARQSTCLNLGLFGAHQAAFEHKPWVETSLRQIGIPTIPWRYIADEDQPEVRELLDRGAVVLRRSRTSGGEGLWVATTADAADRQWPSAAEGFVSVAPYFEDAVPVNVGAVVWLDGVSVHYPSLQLIGIEGCTSYPLGYCGNDFGAAQDLEPELLDEIERHTRTIGDWLRARGYLGAFGVDFLIHDGAVLFTEINPRFQGSTHASSRLAVENGLACLVLEHLAATMGLECSQRPPLRRAVEEARPLAHVVVHRGPELPARIDPRALPGGATLSHRGIVADVLTKPTIDTAEGAIVARLTVRSRLTSDGRHLLEPWATAVSSLTGRGMNGSTVEDQP